MTGATLARRRERTGLNRRQLAARLGVSPSMITRWESGAIKISSESAERLELALAGEPVESLETRVKMLEEQMARVLEMLPSAASLVMETDAQAFQHAKKLVQNLSAIDVS